MKEICLTCLDGQTEPFHYYNLNVYDEDGSKSYSDSAKGPDESDETIALSLIMKYSRVNQVEKMRIHRNTTDKLKPTLEKFIKAHNSLIPSQIIQK